MLKPGFNLVHFIALIGLFLCCTALLIFNNGIIAFFLILLFFFGGRLFLRKVTGYTSGRFVVIKNAILIVYFLLAGFICNILCTETNYYFYFDQGSTLKVIDNGSWVYIQNAHQLDTREQYANPNVVIQTIDIKRDQKSFLGKAINSLITQKIQVFIFKPTNEFFLVADPNHGFTPMSVNEAFQRKKSTFLINSSFYDSLNNPLGEIIYCSKRFQSSSKSTGCFNVIQGVPHVGQKTTLNGNDTHPTYACQGHPSVIVNGQMLPKIITLSVNKWKERRYRNLIGEKADGSIVFIASGNGGLLDVKEITQIANLIGVKEASLFDAGVALQYAFQSQGYSYEFSAFNNDLDLGSMIDRIGMNIFGANFIQRSPIYIGVTLKE